MKKIVKDLYSRIKKTYGYSLVALEKIEQDIMGLLKTSESPDGYVSVEEQVDYIYALRETEELLDRTLKGVRKVKKLASKQACITCFSDMLPKVDTQYCSGTPKEKFTFVYPSKRRYDPEKFDQLMESLGIPVSTYGRELVRLNWPEFQAYCNELVSAGHPIPAGLDPDKQISEYEFTVRKKSGVEIADEEEIVIVHNDSETADAPF